MYHYVSLICFIQVGVAHSDMSILEINNKNTQQNIMSTSKRLGILVIHKGQFLKLIISMTQMLCAVNRIIGKISMTYFSRHPHSSLLISFSKPIG